MILVTGGFPNHVATLSVELVHTNGSRICSLPSLKYHTRLATQTGLTMCGGDWDPCRTSCHTLTSSGSWEETHLTQPRTAHTAWGSPQGIILLGGWHSGTGTTSEILTESGETTPGFNLNYDSRYKYKCARYPDEVNATLVCSDACAIEETGTVTITGGLLHIGEWTPLTRVTRYGADGTSEALPDTHIGRYQHACGHYTTSANSIV